MSAKQYRFFGQVQEVNDKGETIDAGWSCLAKWVQYSDYVRLKAENERLRQAGDKLVEVIQDMDVIIDMDSNHPEVSEWADAKEGKPSA